jgi:cob(I)alamin adenosyltransferase
MESKFHLKFKPPRLTINRVYTRQGDAGETRLAGGRIPDRSSPPSVTGG